ncbi:MAG: pyridoxamine 5'-phosphate oxidase family protein [Clostridium sp.]|nr:pyridoxamine 5'-phosphate oxidase family protein [Clostridium sp.]
MREMRRTDRLLTEEEAYEILEKAEYGILSTVCEDGTPYAVPMSYGVEDGAIYMHCTAAGGQKIDNLRFRPKACFTVVADTKVLPEKYGTLYRSAMVFGTVEILEEKDEKRAGLLALLKKYSADYMEGGIKYMEASLDKVYILRLKIDRISGKGRKK